MKAIKRALLIGISEYQSITSNSLSATTQEAVQIFSPLNAEVLNATNGKPIEKVKLDENKSKPIQWKILNGPLNDVDSFAKLFQELGFDNITILKNELATRDEILKEFNNIVASTKEKDIAVVMFSGHGSSFTEYKNFSNGLHDDKKGKLTEALAPYDSFDNIHDNDIRDYEIHEILKKAESHNITLIFDCCHSSGVRSRGNMSTSTRIDRPNLRPHSQMDDFIGWRPKQIDSERTRSVDRGMKVENLRYVLVAACRDDQKAIDDKIDGKGHGFFSYALLQVLLSIIEQGKKQNNMLSNVATLSNEDNNLLSLQAFNWLDIFPEVERRVSELTKNSASKQSPQLVGLSAWRIFGSESKPLPRFFPAFLMSRNDANYQNKSIVSKADENEDSEFVLVKIKAGYLHGIDENLRWRLEFVTENNLTKGFRSPQIKTIFQTIEESWIFATHSTLQVLISKSDMKEFPGEDDWKKTQLKAIMVLPNENESTEHFMSKTQPLAVEEASISENTHISLQVEMQMKAANTLLEWANLKEKYSIAILDNRLVFQTLPDNIVVFSSVLNDDIMFFKNVEAFVRWTRLLKFGNSWKDRPNFIQFPQVQIMIHLKYLQELTHIELSKPFTNESPLEVQAGARFQFEAKLTTTTRSATDPSIYLTLLEFDCDCSINVLYPQPGTHPKPLQPYNPIRIGGLNDSFPVISIPNGAILTETKECFETLRFIVSTFPIDFQFLMQTGIGNSRYVEWECFRGEEDRRGDIFNEKGPFNVKDVVVKIKPNK